MRQFKISLLVLLLVVASGCAGTRLIAVTDPTQRFEFKGFSVLPPSGKDWFIIEPKTVPDPSAVTVVFGKVVGKIHSIAASVRLAYVPIATQTLQDLESFVLEDAKSDPRFKPLKAKAYIDKCLGYDCVRYDFSIEDHAPRDFPGSVLMFTRQGFYVPLPGVPDFYIWVEYSQRFLPGTEPYPLETELEPFLKGLLITPIRSFRQTTTYNFSDDCSWPSGEMESFSFRCEQGAYRMRLKKPGPVHIKRELGLPARAVSIEVDATVASGRGTEPGNALLGIGCLSDESHGYMTILNTNGAWNIMRIEDKIFRWLAGPNEAGWLPGLDRTNRLRIVCEGGSEKAKESIVSFFVNGQKIGSVEDSQGYAPFIGVALYTDTFPGDVVFERFVAEPPPK